MPTTTDLLNMVNVQLLLNPPAFQGYQAVTTTSMANAFIWTSVNFADAGGVVIDNYAGHSTSVNNTRYTIQLAGTYTMCGVVVFSANATGFRRARMAKNGTAVLGSAASTLTVGGGLSTGVSTPTFEVPCVVGDYIELQGLQNSGGALASSIGTDLTSQLWIKFSHQ